jgi:heptosyltransferase-2
LAHLVFQTAFPGDLFLSIPLLKRIREWDPVQPIALACRPGLGEFFLKTELADEVIEIDKRSRAGRRKAATRLRGERWENVFVPHESPRTQLWMARVRSNRGKVSFHRSWNFWIYDYRVKKPHDLPDALRQLSLLAPLDADLAERFADSDIEALRNSTTRSGPFFLASPRIPEWASMRLRTNRPDGKKIFLAPGSVWNTKRWTAQGYESTAKRLLQEGYEVILVGSPAERELCDSIARTAPGLKNMAGRTRLSDLVDLFATGTALICNDSGAMHAAAVADLPTVAIFGPTVLELGFRPWQNKAVIVQRELSCRPCGKHGAQTCPIGTHACMNEVSLEDVMQALRTVTSDTV